MTYRGILTCALVLGTAAPAFAQVCTKPKVLILLDVSGSMLESNGSGTKYTAAKAGINAALQNLEGKAQFGLMTFPSTSTQTNPSGYCWTSGALAVNYGEGTRTQIQAFLDAPGNQPKGSNDTPLYQALSNTAYLEAQIPDIVLVISDGQQDCPGGPAYGDYDYEPDHSPNTRPGYGAFIQSEVAQNRQDVGNVALYLSQNGVKVYSIGFSSNADASTLNLIAVNGGTRRTPSCNANGTSAADANRCYYQANNQTELQNTLQTILYSPSTEQCNGVDDDCDGKTDNEPGTGYVLQQDCPPNFCGKAECLGGHFDNSACTPIVAEECNGLDDDCDGQVDEDLVDRSCGAGGGMERCVAGHWVPLNSEICDEKDNDCDGQIDDGISCACTPGQTGACGDAPVGACTAGTRVCAANHQWGVCTPGQGPVEETCNGIDDDCDGIVDNIDPNCPADCNGQPGVAVCLPGGGTQCRPKFVTIDYCDGKDNDCDGTVDEDGNVTTQGACGMGDQACVNGTLGPIQYSQLPAELCDGRDNNCDGKVDENCGCTHGTTKTCEGQCGAGIQRCEFGRWTECIGADNGQAEICDGKDQNCNGQIDEEAPCPNAGDSCLCGQCVPPCKADGSCENGAACINGMCEIGGCSMGAPAAAKEEPAPAEVLAEDPPKRMIVKGGCDCQSTPDTPTLLFYSLLALAIAILRRV